jgi:hypothetical protein
MSDTDHLLNGRTTSAFPLSIGTSLAFEAIFTGKVASYDPDKAPPKIVDINNYNEMWVNVATLFRNLNGAIPKDSPLIYDKNYLANTISQEIALIESLINDNGALCSPIFYYSTYSDLKSKEDKVKITLRHPNTDLQKKYDSLLKSVTDKVLENKSIDIKELKGYPKPNNKVNGLILTHVPYDLLSKHNFDSLELIESHTGQLKPFRKWNTKYKKVEGEDMSILPFTSKLLPVFGDNYTFSPWPLKARLLILEIAKKYEWSPLTTNDRINLSLEVGSKDVFVKNSIKEINI